jgi:hypothetical protein
VVLRSNYTTATIRLAVKQNTDGVAAIPALTQIDNDIWEIGLSEFTVTTGGVITVTDSRPFAKTSTAVDVSRGIDWDSRNRLGIADEGVIAAMAGGGVPVLTDRQGGSATDWSAQGTTNYSVGNASIQVGASIVTIPAGESSEGLSVTFPVAFAQPPLVVAQIQTAETPVAIVLFSSSGSASTHLFGVRTADGSNVADDTVVGIDWIATGSR